jgi:hypothetical protein
MIGIIDHNFGRAIDLKDRIINTTRQWQGESVGRVHLRKTTIRNSTNNDFFPFLSHRRILVMKRVEPKGGGREGDGREEGKVIADLPSIANDGTTETG